MATQVLIRCLEWSIVRCNRDVSNAPSDELIGDHVASYRVQHLIGERSKGAYVVQRFIAGGSLKDRIKAVVDHRTWP